MIQLSRPTKPKRCPAAKTSRLPATSSIASCCPRSSTASAPTAAASASRISPSGRRIPIPATPCWRCSAPDEPTLERILAQIADHGATPVVTSDCRLAAADMAGAFPEDFYSTTNQRTEIRLAGQWLQVDDQEMDCGVVVDPAARAARCLPMTEVRLGDLVVVGHAGVRVFPEERSRPGRPSNSWARPSRPRSPRASPFATSPASCPRTVRGEGGTAVVGGPAIVHTGSGAYVQQLIRRGYIDLLFAGNALATHDIEQALFEHEPGRVSRTRGTGRGRARAPPARHQPHPPRRRHSPGRAGRAVELGHHVRMRASRGADSCWPAASATTARCRK